MEEGLKQIFYRALVDTTYGKEGFSKVPLTEECFGNYTELAKYIVKHYQQHDGEISTNELKLVISSDLKKRRKYTDESYLALAQDVNDIAHLANEDNYTSSKVIENETVTWIYKQLTVKRIKRFITESDTSQAVLEKLADDLDDISHFTSASNLGETVSLFNEDDEERRIEYAQQTYANVISTGWENLDGVCDGGLGYGEMGMLIAPSGAGKTTLLMNLAMNYSLEGQNVLYFVLEERMGRMQNKMLSMLSNKSRRYYYNTPDNNENNKGETSKPELDITRFTNLNKYMEKAYKESRVGDIRLWLDAPYTLSPKDIERVLGETLRKDGKYPDIMIIDYPELLKNPFERTSSNEYSAMGKLYHELRSIANRYKICLWVVSQTNRTGYAQDIKTAASIEGSKEKINSCEFVGTLNQTPDEYTNKFLRIFCDKSRNKPTDSEGKMEMHSMLKFVIDPKTLRIKTETEEESQHHDDLLASSKESGGKPAAFKKSAKQLSDLRNSIPDSLRI